MSDLERAASEAETKELEAGAERRKAVDELQEACLELASSRSETDVAVKRCEELAEANGRLEREKEALTRRVSELSDELAAAKEELLDRLDAETQVREFEAMLTQVEEMKAGYERRIERLRRALVAAREAGGLAATPSAELMEIDMTDTGVSPAESPESAGPPPEALQSTRRPEAGPGDSSVSPPADPEADWLQMLPE